MNGIDVAAIHYARIASLGMGSAQLDDPGAPVEGRTFADGLRQALNEASAVEDHSDSVTSAFLRGDPGVEMHQVMAAAEEAGIAVEMLVGVSNKLQDAYRTLIGTQS